MIEFTASNLQYIRLILHSDGGAWPGTCCVGPCPAQTWPSIGTRLGESMTPRKRTPSPFLTPSISSPLIPIPRTMGPAMQFDECDNTNKIKLTYEALRLSILLSWFPYTYPVALSFSIFGRADVVAALRINKTSNDDTGLLIANLTYSTYKSINQYQN